MSRKILCLCVTLVLVTILGCASNKQPITVRPGGPVITVKPKTERAPDVRDNTALQAEPDSPVSDSDAVKTGAAVKEAQVAKGRTKVTVEVKPIAPGALEEMPLVQTEVNSPPPDNKFSSSELRGPPPREESGNAAPRHPPEKRYSLTMRDSDVKSVLMSFSREGEYNIVIDPDISGTVTMDLKEVSLDQALGAVLVPLGYNYKREENTIRVSKLRLDTRVFSLNCLNTVRKGRATVRADTSGSIEQKDKSTEVVTESSTDMWTELQSGLQNMLSRDGKFFLNKAVSVVVVSDYPRNLEKVAEFLEAVEGTSQRQVLIEASVMEVALSDDYKMGINWSQILGGHGSLDQKTFSPVGDPGAFQTGVLQFAFNLGNLSGLVHALSTQGRAEILSKPRITTLNNQTAIIKVGTEDVYFEQEQQTTTTSQSTNLKARFFTVGMVMDVTPQIGSGDEITMHVHPVVTEKVSEKTVTIPSIPPSPSFEMKVPVLSVRETSSVVKVKSGQTLVIAGLLMDKNKDTINGVPRLKDIPVFGPLFQYKSTTKEKTELIVTLTPRILAGKKLDDFPGDQISEIIRRQMTTGAGALNKQDVP